MLRAMFGMMIADRNLVKDQMIRLAEFLCRRRP
jgi:hypothetical protein